MEVDLREAGALIVRASKGVPFYEAKWRDATRKQRKRRLGRAWLEPDPEGGWRKRRGRVRDGFLDEKRAYREMSRVIAEVEAEQQIAPKMRDARFEDAVEIWFEHLEFEKRANPPPSPATGACSQGRDIRGRNVERGSCASSAAASWPQSRRRTSGASWRGSTASRSAPAP